MVTRNADELLSRSLSSIQKIADEVIVVDAESTDHTLEILRSYKIAAVRTRSNHLGRNKSKALSLATNELVLSLDSDEILSPSLIREIRQLKERREIPDGYIIPFHNHFLGKHLRHGGENYKMVRLARRSKVRVKNVSVHESLLLNSANVGYLQSPILHYSYRSILQMLRKFTTYALNDADERFRKSESSSIKKIILYPIHMFWARFIQDEGYKDGIFRIPLDLGFAYMELLTYTALAVKNINK